MTALFQEFTREMTQPERRDIKAILSSQPVGPTLGHTLRWLLLWVVGLAPFSGLMGWTFGDVGGAPLVLAVALPYFIWSVCQLFLHATGGGYLREWRDRRNYLRTHLQRLAKRLENGKVTVKEFAATAVIEIDQFEDEGQGYIFDLGHGQLLFLKGQQYEYPEDDAPWPNTRFDLVCYATDGELIGIFCHGEALKPIEVIDCTRCREEIVWGGFEDVVEGDLRTFAASLLKAG